MMHPRNWNPISEHLAVKRAELAADLDGRCLIYLDTKHWVNLCNVLVASSQQLAIYSEIFKLLKSLRMSGCICCPLSSTLFAELMKQRDVTTRVETAKLMDFLSGGVCLQNWLALVKAEFGRHICRVFKIEIDCDTAFPIWTKIGFWAGEHALHFTDQQICNEILQKMYLDERWHMTCVDYQAVPGWVPTPASFYDAWIGKAEKGKSPRGSLNGNIAKEVRVRRRQLLDTLKETLLPLFAICAGQPGTADDHVRAVLDPILEGKNLNALPSLEVLAGVDAAVAFDSNRKVEANDLEDYLHAAQAVPYCDAFFCDNYLAQKVSQKTLGFSNMFKTKIGSRPEEIIDYLNSMNSALERQ